MMIFNMWLYPWRAVTEYKSKSWNEGQELCETSLKDHERDGMEWLWFSTLPDVHYSLHFGELTLRQILA